MKKIGIITFHRAKNYGAVLQTYALARAMRELGADCEVVDFWTKYLKKASRLIRFDGAKLKWRFKNLARCLQYLGYNMRRRNRCFRFVEKHVPLSAPVTEKSVAAYCEERYRALITGSDQVFNAYYTGVHLKNYLLSFVPESVERYSYAASVGSHIDRITEEEKELYIREWNKFKDLSIRESNGVALVKELTGRDAHLHLDPTLLVRAEQWAELCEKPKQESHYILMYMIFNSTAAYEYAQQLSASTGMPVYCILGSAIKKARKVPFKIRYIRDCSPEQFLGLVQGASQVITTSFHGTVFSIQFRKPFVAFLSKKNKTDDRIETLLKLTGLESRLWSQDFHDTGEIDWEYADRQLDVEREKAKEYLRGIIA